MPGQEQNPHIVCTVLDKDGHPIPNENGVAEATDSVYKFSTDPGTEAEKVMAATAAGDAALDRLFAVIDWDQEAKPVVGNGALRVVTRRADGSEIGVFQILCTAQVFPFTKAEG